MGNEEKDPLIPGFRSVQDLAATHQSQPWDLEDDMPTEQLQPQSFKEALIGLLPRDNYDVLITIGILVGILHYWATKDMWLLMTFIGFWTGRATSSRRTIT